MSLTTTPPRAPAPASSTPTRTLVRRRAGQTGRRLAGYIFGVYALLAILIVLGSVALIHQDRDRQRAAQQTQIISLTRALQEHVARSFGEADSALRSMSTVLFRQHSSALATQASLLRDEAQQQLMLYPQVAALAAHNAKGGEIVVVRQHDTTRTIPPPRASAQDIMARLPLQVLKPFRDATGRWLLPVQKVVHDDKGEMIGTVSALLNFDHVSAFYQDIRLSAQDSVFLLDLDGRVIINFPNPTPIFGSQALFAGVSTHATRDAPDLYTAEFDLQGTRSLGAFRHLREYPVIVGSSRPINVAYADFFEIRSRHIIAGTALIVLLSALAWLTYFDLRRRERLQQELGSANARLERRVHQRTSELEQSNRELIAFSYSVSHDLRAPLRAINGFAHALREDNGEQLDPQGREYLERICRASLRMGELIDELLNLTNVSRAPLKVTSVNLSAMAQDILDELRIANPDRDVHCYVEENLRTDGDETLLHNALSNLLNNAWKFTRAKSPAIIRFSAEQADDCIRYMVEDNGIGFDMAHARRLFQPFQQLHANQGFGGTGIGLASVRRIIERHDGEVYVEARPEGGARFIVALPRQAKVMHRRDRSPAQT